MQSRQEKKAAGVYLYARERESAISIWKIYESSLALTGLSRLEGKVCWEGDHLGTDPVNGAAFIYCDVSERAEIERLKEIRNRNPSGWLTVRICGPLAPQEIVTPSNRVSSLLGQEADEEEIRTALRDQILLTVSPDRVPADSRLGTYRVMVPLEGNRIMIPAEEIIFMEAKDKGILMHSMEGDFFFRGTLKSYEGAGGGCFVRTHKGYLVNACHIIRLNLPQAYMVLSDFSKVPVSRHYRALLLKAVRALTCPIGY